MNMKSVIFLKQCGTVLKLRLCSLSDFFRRNLTSCYNTQTGNGFTNLTDLHLSWRTCYSIKGLHKPGTSYCLSLIEENGNKADKKLC